MATQRAIPFAFHPENPEMLKRELEELSATLAPYFSALSGSQHAAIVQKRFVNRPVNSTTAAFGEVTRISLVEGQVLKISLPRRDMRNAGLLIGIARATAPGNVFLSSPGCLVNGLDIARLTNAPSFVLVEFDGENYYTSPGGTAIGFSAGGL
jgi:hypothetical protein